MYEKDKTLIAKAQQGNQDALAQILEENQGLIWSIVKKFIGRGYETEDIYQIACIGFIKAIQRFRLDLGNELSTYSVQYMFGEIKKFFRDDGIIHVSRISKENGLKLKIECIQDENFMCSQEDEQAKLIDKITVSEMVKRLNKREQDIIHLRYYKDKTQMQVAKILGISQVHVSRLEKKILKDLKSELTT